MDKINQTTQREEAQDNIIELGVASIETKGTLSKEEEIGGSRPMGISDE